MPRVVHRIAKIDTRDALDLSEHERGVLIDVLEHSFRPETLELCIFYASLVNNEARSTDGDYLDHKLTHMCINYPIARKRNRLCRLIKAMQQKDYVSLLQYEWTLDEIIPSVEEYSIVPEYLEELTQVRMKTLGSYFARLEEVRADHPHLSNQSNFDQLKRIMYLANNMNNTFVCLDVEVYENDSRIVTEVGLSIYDPSKSTTSLTPTFKNIHLIIEENQEFRNGIYCPDKRDEFNGGTSMIVSQSHATELVQCLLDYYFEERCEETGQRAILVGQGIHSDIKWLGQMGVIFPSEMETIDTQKLFMATHGKKFSGLGKILVGFGIPFANLHNAGNDAYYTLQVLLNLADPLFRRSRDVDDPDHINKYTTKVVHYERHQVDDKSASKNYNSWKQCLEDVYL